MVKMYTFSNTALCIRIRIACQSPVIQTHLLLGAPAWKESGGMMVDVEEADLALVLLQHHDQCVCKLIRLP